MATSNNNIFDNAFASLDMAVSDIDERRILVLGPVPAHAPAARVLGVDLPRAGILAVTTKEMMDVDLPGGTTATVSFDFCALGAPPSGHTFDAVIVLPNTEFPWTVIPSTLSGLAAPAPLKIVLLPTASVLKPSLLTALTSTVVASGAYLAIGDTSPHVPAALTRLLTETFWPCGESLAALTTLLQRTEGIHLPAPSDDLPDTSEFTAPELPGPVCPPARPARTVGDPESALARAAAPCDPQQLRELLRRAANNYTAEHA